MAWGRLISRVRRTMNGETDDALVDLRYSGAIFALTDIRDITAKLRRVDQSRPRSRFASTRRCVRRSDTDARRPKCFDALADATSFTTNKRFEPLV